MWVGIGLTGGHTISGLPNGGETQLATSFLETPHGSWPQDGRYSVQGEKKAMMVVGLEHVGVWRHGGVAEVMPWRVQVQAALVLHSQ